MRSSRAESGLVCMREHGLLDDVGDLLESGKMVGVAGVEAGDGEPGLALVEGGEGFVGLGGGDDHGVVEVEAHAGARIDNGGEVAGVVVIEFEAGHIMEGEESAEGGDLGGGTDEVEGAGRLLTEPLAFEPGEDGFDGGWGSIHGSLSSARADLRAKKSGRWSGWSVCWA